MYRCRIGLFYKDTVLLVSVTEDHPSRKLIVGKILHKMEKLLIPFSLTVEVEDVTTSLSPW